ncbi:MFS transporter [Streptomyces sp. ET3-23]|uniref:MFS transporter n=1 Tax=Streptomyces morookaense TaxID=1970 RepID=A0A7Y7B5P2_STRMO|nr:MFS transporter [Streptomyces sp. ET3-23]MCC2276060.1 MFS transporter [Streptomyces sp. ET3-23]NVK79493.1 MFS transporter [Streptomyces morookaense]
MMTLRATREFPLALRLLFINQFGVDIGFYLLMPFLAAYLEHGLGMSAALVGLVLGARTLSQQGLFILGGSAADRLGPRMVIIAGCALRTVAFALFAFGNSLPLVLAASLLSGVAAAMFYPAVRTYVALESGDRHAEAFALLNVYATVGSFLGLLLGSVLFMTDFRIFAVSGAAVCTVLTVAQAMVLPRQAPVDTARSSVFADWREAFGNGRFLLFSFATTGMITVENQVYLLLPAGALKASGWTGSAGVLLALGALVNMLFQLRITRMLERHGGGLRWVSAGLVVMGLGFVPPLLVCEGTLSRGLADSVPRMLVLVLGSLMLYFGTMVAHPTVMEMIPRFGREALTGTYFGLFYVFSGLAAMGGNFVVGRAMDLGERTGLAWLPWIVCLGFGLASATAVSLLYRTFRLPGRTLLTSAPAAEAEIEGITAVRRMAMSRRNGSPRHAVARRMRAEHASAPLHPPSSPAGRGQTAPAGEGSRPQNPAPLSGPARAAGDAADQPPR